MSQLIDKLNQFANDTLKPMGFRTSQAASVKQRMLLIASLSQAEGTEHLADSVAGADATLLHIAKPSWQTKTLKGITRSLPDIPWGSWVGNIDEKRIGTMVAAGGDFMVFPASNPVSAISQDDKVGKILQIESSLSGDLIRTVNELPVDAVLANDEPEKEYPLTWHHLMLFQRLANLLTKPLLVSIPLKTTAGELEALWEAGIDGVVVAVSTRQPTGGVKALRQTIDSLTSLSPRKRGKTEALLPHIGGETSTVTDIEEDEEEE